MKYHLKITKGVILGSGSKEILVEKVNDENIYLKMKSTGQCRIIPTKLVADILTSLMNNQITIRDIDRKYRTDNKLPHLFEELNLNYDKYLLGYDASIKKICNYELSQPETNKTNNFTELPKPFILLSGISGTGKTRFVRKQAEYHRDDHSNYCIVPVRPDWHEPSDLLGYISRLGDTGPRYIVTEFLRFMVAAWKDATEAVTPEGWNLKDNSPPYWLCLDEMNLAPVEQYFADYLSCIESRKWLGDDYYSSPILMPSVFKQLGESGKAQLRTDLDLDGSENEAMWQSLLDHGLEIPPNLIVAGTVNMDETTHGFSRKVIDRAFTIDFGEFFPNDYHEYFKATSQAKSLTYPMLSKVSLDDLSSVASDMDGNLSIAFLEAINNELKHSPFELAFRALNELLISVICFQPATTSELQAVWDDFLMTKVLPRIEGDAEKLQDTGESNILNPLENVLAEQLNEIWPDDTQRLDLLRESDTQEALTIPCRSKKKIRWMNERLTDNGFTTFWP